MTEEVDNKLLASAIDDAESEITALNQKKKVSAKKTDEKTTITKTEKKGAVTKKITATKKYKNPSEFVDNPIAKSINTIIDRALKEEGIGHECEFGECMALVIDYYLTDLPEHPLIYLGMSSGTLLFIALQKKNMLPNLFGGNDDKPKQQKEPEDAISRKTKKQLDTEKKGKPIIIETDEYKRLHQKEKTEKK